MTEDGNARGKSPGDPTGWDGARARVPAGRRVRSVASAWRWLLRQLRFFLFRYREASSLAPRGLRSLKVRGLRPTVRLVRKRLFLPRRQPFRLELYSDFDGGTDVRLPAPDAPRATVIVPVHEQLPMTLRCLHALSRSGDRTPYEVLLVDDASSEDTGARLAAVPGLRYLRNDSNLGFIGSCNAGARQARGDFLVFLNNDTLVQPGWLDALLDTFAQNPGTGLAGSKLVYPDGRLQEAGGIVHADGAPANYGRFEDPLEPRFNFVRLADYCSGAALAIPRALFAELGGFDPLYAPAYFEDTDLAMRVHARGLAVRYQPASVVVHLEGASSGTDPHAGVKAHQTRNAVKFRERWRDVLDQGFPPHDLLDLDGDAANRAARHRYRRQVLVIDSYTPTPDRDSGSVRMVELLGLLVEAGCGVVFFSQNLAHDGRYTEALQRLGVEVWWHPWIRSVTQWLDRHGDRFDAVIVSRHYVLSPLLPMLREMAPRAHVVFDTVDLHFLREQREAEQSGDPVARRTASRTRESELALLRESDSTWVVSSVERDLLHALEPDADVRVVSNIHAASAVTPGFDARQGLVFVGSYRHPPNVDAACWMVQDILPRVRERIPGIELLLVGADATEAVLALGNLPGVRFLGHVPDLEALLDRTRISVAPLRFGAGIKGKINQSLARGLPVVATPCAVEGMFLQDGVDVLRAESAEDFAHALVRLYQDRVLWEQLRDAGIENTRAHFSRDNARAVLLPWLDGLGTHGTPSGVDRDAETRPPPAAAA